MEIDINLIPATLDVVHVGLAGLAAVSLLLSLLLAIIAIVALRRKPAPLPVPAPAPVPPVAPKSQPVPSPQPARSEPVKPVVIRESTPDAALQLLGLLCQLHRLTNFFHAAQHGRN